MSSVRWTWRAMPAGLAAAIGACGPSAPHPTHVAAVIGESGRGPGAFAYPRGIAAAPDGTFYVVDKSARVQRFTADGGFLGEWRMPDHASGKPVGLSVHRDGRVFVADTHYHRVVVFDADGAELARFGAEGDGDGRFRLPTDVAFDAAGSVYVAEYGGNDRITRWTPDLAYDRVVVSGEVNGEPMRRPAAIVIDDGQSLWVADACNHRLLEFDLEGRLRRSFGSIGREAGQLRYPYGLDVDRDGHLVVCEYGNCRVQWFDRTGRSLGVWGGPGREVGRLNSPWGLFSRADGGLVVLDSLNMRIQVVRP